MIKFIPKTVEVSSPLSDPENFASNIANKNLAVQLNSKLGNNFCQDHPDFENIIFVNYKKGSDLMTVQSYCCITFKEKLDLITKNKLPFFSDMND